MTAHDSQLQALAQAWKDSADADVKARSAHAAAKEMESRVLPLVCPEIVRQSRFVPLTKTTALIVHRIEMSQPLTPNRLPHWTAYGSKVRFRVGNQEAIGPGSIEQPVYEALPEDVKSLDRAGMVESSREQKLTGMDKPLKVTARQGWMLSMLATNNERLHFSASPVEEGQRLPSGIWDSVSSTQSIWTAMVKRGVLVMVKGQLSDRWSQWRVNPGPRFQEAVEIVGQQLAKDCPGSMVTESFQRAFGGSGADVSTAPTKRPKR